MYKEIRVTGLKHSVNAGARLVLTDDQIRRRRHALEVLETVDDGTICEVTSPVEFKQGEILFTDQEVNKQQAEEIAETGGEEEDVQEQEGSDAPEPDETEEEGEGEDDEPTLDEKLGAMNLGQLREALDNRKIQYAPNAKEPNLRKKLKAAIEEEREG